MRRSLSYLVVVYAAGDAATINSVPLVPITTGHRVQGAEAAQWLPPRWSITRVTELRTATLSLFLAAAAVAQPAAAVAAIVAAAVPRQNTKEMPD